MNGTSTAVLYRYYSAPPERLLYVGVTVRDPDLRQIEHKFEKPWAAEIARAEASVFSTVELALAAERQAIATEHPAHNREAARVLSTYCSAPRKREHRDRMKAQGFALLEGWVHRDDKAAVKAFIEQLRTARQEPPP